MNLHYRVKFILNNELHYGVVESLTKQARTLARKGMFLIHDAILQETYQLKEAEIIDIPIRHNGEDEYNQFVSRSYHIAQETSNSLGNVVADGKLIRILLDAGFAYYIVDSVGNEKVHLSWRGFSLDRWVNPKLGYGKTIPLDECVELLEFEGIVVECSKTKNMYEPDCEIG